MPNIPLEPFIGLPVPWTQHVGARTPSPTNASLAWGDSQATLTVDVYWGDVILAVQNILGTAFRGTLVTTGLTSIAVNNGGMGYTSPPSVFINNALAGNGAGAWATATLGNNGTITGFTVQNAGGWYGGNLVNTNDPSLVIISGGGGSGASGTPFFGNVNAPVVNRVMPARHPTFTNFVCTKIQNAQPLGFIGNTPGLADAIIPVPPTAAFKFYRLTCLFQPPAYNVLDDATLRAGAPNNGLGAPDESKRFVIYKRTNILSALSRRGADFQWTNGPGKGQRIPFGLVQQLGKEQIIAQWLHVPEQCIYPTFALGPSPNIESCYGACNFFPWNGYAAQTVLFDNWWTEPEEAPVPFSIGDWVIPQRLLTVYLSFRVFDPPVETLTGPRGWNLQPYTNGYWYFAGQNSDLSQGIIPARDFSRIFLPN